MSERTHRHQLEKNLLADWLAEKVEVLKPYGTQLAVGGLIAVAAVIGAIFYFSQADTVTPRSWQAYFAAFGEDDKAAEALKEVFETKPQVKGTAAELWARLSYADQRFQFAAVQLAQDAQEAKVALSDAEKALTPIEGKTSDPLLLARSRYSLARIYETQNKLNKAREYYQKVAEAGKDSALGKRAAEAVQRLAPDSEASQVLAWLAEQKPPATKGAGSGNPFLDSFGSGFGQEPTLPERPNLNLPGSGSPFGTSGSGGIDFGRDDPLGSKGIAPERDAPELDSPQGGEPATKTGDGETPAGEKPAEVKPAAEKAAEPAKTVNEKPAADKS